MRHRYVIASTRSPGKFALIRVTPDDDGALLDVGDRAKLVRLRDRLIRREASPGEDRTIVGLGVLLPE